jgi:hypothetical protein
MNGAATPRIFSVLLVFHTECHRWLRFALSHCGACAVVLGFDFATRFSALESRRCFPSERLPSQPCCCRLP